MTCTPSGRGRSPSSISTRSNAAAPRSSCTRAFTRASSTPVDGAKTDRLAALLVPRGATRYVTGLGALDYLDAPHLAAVGIDVRVMQYTRRPYPQLHGAFDPHVSILDAIANLGPAAASVLESPAIPWADVAAAAAQVAG